MMNATSAPSTTPSGISMYIGEPADEDARAPPRPPRSARTRRSCTAAAACPLCAASGTPATADCGAAWMPPCGRPSPRPWRPWSAAGLRGFAMSIKDTGRSRRRAAPDGSCAHWPARSSLPARYDERTSGPASTPANPSRSANCACSTNSSGLTQRSTGWWRADGRRYWVMVTMSQPASCRSRSAVRTSSGVSPMPRMRLVLVTRPYVARRGEHVEAALVAERRAGSA